MGWDGIIKGKKTEIKEEFEIAVHTVTQDQWHAIMGKNPSSFSREGRGKAKVKDIPDADLKQFPVESVSWNDAQVFIKKLNEKEAGRGYRYRLPTQAEWEYACRGEGPLRKKNVRTCSTLPSRPTTCRSEKPTTQASTSTATIRSARRTEAGRTWVPPDQGGFVCAEQVRAVRHARQCLAVVRRPGQSEGQGSDVPRRQLGRTVGPGLPGGSAASGICADLLVRRPRLPPCPSSRPVAGPASEVNSRPLRSPNGRPRGEVGSERSWRRRNPRC